MAAEIERIGPYEIRGRLGQGAMAVVWLGYDPSLDRHVAIKEPLAPPVGDPEERGRFSERFVREARAAARLTHPGIVTIHSTATYDGRPIIVMELVEGPTLRQVLDVRHLTHEETWAVMEQLLEAVAYAHAAGVVHRDLKPDNVFVTPGGTIKLADFGVARMDTDATVTRDGAIIGTPAYMAPEQVLGKEVGATTDVFALGDIAWELVCGSTPFSGPAGTHVVTMLHRIVSAELPELPVDDPKAVALLAVAERALSKAEDDRFADAGEMLTAWRAVRPGVVDARGAIAGLAALVPAGSQAAASAVRTAAWGAGIAGGGAAAGAAVAEGAPTEPLPAQGPTQTPRPTEAAATTMIAGSVAGSKPKWPLFAGAAVIAALLAVGGAARAGIFDWNSAQPAMTAEPTQTVSAAMTTLVADSSKSKATKDQEFIVSVAVDGTSLPDGTVVLLERSNDGIDWKDGQILRLSGGTAHTTTTIRKTTYFMFATLGDSQTAPISSNLVRVTYVKPPASVKPRPKTPKPSPSETPTTGPGAGEPGTDPGTDPGGGGSGEPSATP